jgi:hypothetical protein
MSRKLRAVLAVGVIGITTLAAGTGATASRKERSATLLEFESMIGNPRPYTGAPGALRGINAGGAPWALTNGHGELKSNGRLELAISGLVLDPLDPALVTAGVAGTVPAPILAAGYNAVVSCLSKDASGAAVTVNVPAGAVPTDTAGNALFKTRVTLPKPCIAPIVLVTSATGTAWFATTGG